MEASCLILSCVGNTPSFGEHSSDMSAKLRVLALFMIILCLAGCKHGGEKAATGVTTIEFWNGFTGPDGKTMEKIVRRFNEEHKEVHYRCYDTKTGEWSGKGTAILKGGKFSPAIKGSRTSIALILE